MSMGSVGLNLTAVPTVEAGRYDLSKVDPVAASEFVRHLVTSKHAFYDWGWHHLWVCKIPFVVDYDQKTILTETGEPVGDDQWIGVDPGKLDEELASLFEGEYGITGTDFVSVLFRSGICVDIFDTKEFGPANPKEFLAQLRAALAV